MSETHARPGSSPGTVNEVERLYSPTEIAAILGLHKNQVYPLFKPGGIWPIARLNPRVIRVRASVLNRYIDRHTWNPKPIAPATVKAARAILADIEKRDA